MKQLAPFAACLALAACDTSGPDALRIPGELLRNAPNFPALTAPDTVIVGRQFTVTTFTIGGGCFREGDTEFTSDEGSAEVRPFDFFLDPGPDGACTADLAYYPHTATFALFRPGVATIRVVGTAGRPGFGAPTPETPRVAVEKTVVVVAP